MRQIDFTEQEKEAAHESKQNANAVALRLKKPQKRITRQVRMSTSLIRRLKVYAAEEEQPMSRLLDDIVETFLCTRGR